MFVLEELRATYPEFSVLALAERIDIGWSWLRLRLKPKWWRDCAAHEFRVDELCPVCEARWRIGRGLRHGICAAGLDRAYERELEKRKARP